MNSIGSTSYRPRNPGHDYYEKGVYHITLVVTEREPMLCRLNDSPSLKKRRHDGNLEQRAERITFDAVPRHRYSLLVIKLCILIYTHKNCGLRIVVKILEIG